MHDGPGQPDGGANRSPRYLRAPVRPAPSASYDPARARNGDSAGRHQRRPAIGGGRAAYAALDLGTNNCRLLVAVPLAGGRFRVVDAFSRIVRLGEGMATSGRLSPAAMDRAVEALAVCAAKMATHDLAGKRLIATEACRSAANGDEFLARVARETGLHLEIVDRQTEARLAAEGCGSLMDRQAEAAVLFDIGGGSSELILVNRRRATGRRISEQIAAWTSMPVGVVTLSERHGGRHVTRAGFDAMVADVLEQLAAFEQRGALADVWHPARTHLLGTSGTVTTIAGVHLGLARYDRRKVDGVWLSGGQIDTVIDALIAMDYEARAGNPCIGRERADLVLAGCAILQAIRLTWPSPRLRVADRGLREGILSELMHEAGEWRPRRQHAHQRHPAGAGPGGRP
ncbi:MAG: exopolyphosphatase [Alphaproteobacteria bacterium]|nr:MAG: exopolyphosphatase [Alphaproteobacteria bacterium]